MRRGEMEEKRLDDAKRRAARARGMPAYKRRRLRGGQQPQARRSISEEELWVGGSLKIHSADNVHLDLTRKPSSGLNRPLEEEKSVSMIIQCSGCP